MLLENSLPLTNSIALYIKPIIPNMVKRVPKILFKFIVANVCLKESKTIAKKEGCAKERGVFKEYRILSM